MANGLKPTYLNPALGLPVAALLAMHGMSCTARTDMDPVSARAAFSSKSRSLHATAAETTLSAATADPTPSRAQPTTSPDEAASRGSVSIEPVSIEPVSVEAAPAHLHDAPATTTATTVTADREAQPEIVEASIAPSEATITQAPTAGDAASAADGPASEPRGSRASVPPSLSSEPTEPRAILEAAARSSWPSLRAYAMEASISRPRLLAEHASRALADENRGVRFVTCMAIAQSGQVQYVELLRPLLADPSDSVRAAAMLALTRSGEKVNLTPLAAMLQCDDPEVRANAQLVLGELGNASAIPLIRDSLGQGMTLVNPLRVRLIDLSAAEALVKLGQKAEVEPIRAALFAPPEQGELTVVACDAVRRIHDGGSIPMLERIATVRGRAERSPEIRLAAARALQALGVRQGPLAVATPLVGHPDARVRAQAAIVLGEIGTAEARSLLEPLLRDGDPAVKVAAAAGLDLSEAGSMSAIGSSVGPRN
jgi:HEAT repeat protein